MYKLGYQDTLRQFGLLEKQALLGRLVGLAKYPYGKPAEEAVRKWSAKYLAPWAARLTGGTVTGANRIVQTATLKRKEIPLAWRRRAMETALRHPAMLLGAAVPGGPIGVGAGMTAAGGLSVAAKRLGKIPILEHRSRRFLDAQLRAKGYKGLEDYLRKTQPFDLPRTPPSAPSAGAFESLRSSPSGSIF